MGRRLCGELVGRGHTGARAGPRGIRGAAGRGVKPVAGDPLDGSTYRDAWRAATRWSTWLASAIQVRRRRRSSASIDLASALQAIRWRLRPRGSRISCMSAWRTRRRSCGNTLRRGWKRSRRSGESGLNATILRPWYVLGPGRRWPLVLTPLYWLMEAIPSTRDGARRLGLVSCGADDRGAGAGHGAAAGGRAGAGSAGDPAHSAI